MSLPKPVPAVTAGSVVKRCCLNNLFGDYCKFCRINYSNIVQPALPALALQGRAGDISFPWQWSGVPRPAPPSLQCPPGRGEVFPPRNPPEHRRCPCRASAEQPALQSCGCWSWSADAPPGRWLIGSTFCKCIWRGRGGRNWCKIRAICPRCTGQPRRAVVRASRPSAVPRCSLHPRCRGRAGGNTPGAAERSRSLRQALACTPVCTPTCPLRARACAGTRRVRRRMRRTRSRSPPDPEKPKTYRCRSLKPGRLLRSRSWAWYPT